MTQIRDSNTTPPSAPLPSKKFLFSIFDWGKELLSVDNTTKKTHCQGIRNKHDWKHGLIMTPLLCLKEG